MENNNTIEVLKKEINEYECVLALDDIKYAKVTEKDKELIKELLTSHKEACLALEKLNRLEKWIDDETKNLKEYYKDLSIVSDRDEIILTKGQLEVLKEVRSGLKEKKVNEVLKK